MLVASLFYHFQCTGSALHIVWPCLYLRSLNWLWGCSSFLHSRNWTLTVHQSHSRGWLNESARDAHCRSWCVYPSLSEDTHLRAQGTFWCSLWLQLFRNESICHSPSQICTHFWYQCQRIHVHSVQWVLSPQLQAWNNHMLLVKVDIWRWTESVRKGSIDS